MIEIDRVLISSKGYNLTIMIVFQSGYSYEFDFGKKTIKKGEELI